MTETFVKERTHAVTGKVQPVGIDDAAAVLTRFANGSLGTFESTRYARGHKALYTLEINGEHGSLAWDLHDLNRLPGSTIGSRGRCAAGARSWSPTATTPTSANGGCRALIIGYEHSFVHTMADFIASLDGGEPRPGRRFATRWRRRGSATRSSLRAEVGGLADALSGGRGWAREATAFRGVSWV